MLEIGTYTTEEMGHKNDGYPAKHHFLLKPCFFLYSFSMTLIDSLDSLVVSKGLLSLLSTYTYFFTLLLYYFSIV